jgi:signal transduction histidine kinase/ActR/RegA family two-component response regulator
MLPATAATEQRVLVLMPSVRDAERTIQMLSEAHVASRTCADVAALRAEASRGAGALLLTQEVLSADTNDEIGQLLRAQEPWSMLPLLLIVWEHVPESVERTAVGHYPSMTVLEKPVRARTLIGAVQSALRGRANQYQVRDLLRERERQSRELAAQDEKLRSALAVLSKQADQLRSTDKLKDQFLATLAHELRNPLAPITAGLSVLETGGDPAKREHTLGIMRRQVNHMVRLIDDLLDVSRITTGKLDLKMERFTVRSAIEAAIEASMPSLNRGQQALKVDIADEVLHLHADQTRVAQMVSNLLNNASKYTPNGGNVELSVRRDGEEVVISVRDDGIGIPPDRLEDVFQMFEQVNAPLDRSQGGLGIGLALVRRLVEMHGGSVHATSDGNGKGSTFTVRLPTAQRRSTPIPIETPLANKALNGVQRILIVDDNEDAGELLAFMLQQDGFEAVIAKDGPSAIEAAGTLQPNVVILDIGLPGMNGYEVAVKLRQDARHSNLSIIALTGWGSPEDKRRALEAGFDVHLTKPVFADDLRRAMNALKPAASPAPGSA